MEITVRPSHVGFKYTALALALAASSSCALAQEVQPLESITVIGQGARLEKSLQQQRASDKIESVISSDAVAQLPDENAAEALQRAPGVSVQRDQGEGRFVIVRGLGADLNSVTINGTQVPAPESDRRAVAMDVLPSELIKSMSVIKTLTPDMDANSLGGTIEVETLSAFDHDGPFSTVTLEGSYNDMVDKVSPKGSGALTRRFSVGDGKDNLGVALAFSWQKRDFGSENIETGGAWDFSDGARLEEAEMDAAVADMTADGHGAHRLSAGHHRSRCQRRLDRLETGHQPVIVIDRHDGPARHRAGEGDRPAGRGEDLGVRG